MGHRVPVRFVPAYSKLTVYGGPEVECTLKTPYARRKFFARRYTQHYLHTVPSLAPWRPFFEGCRSKQDDVADAFLKAIQKVAEY